MRAVLPVIKNKTEYSIDDIIGEAIRDPAHSGAVANPQPPRYIISSEEGLKSMLVRIKENAEKYRDPIGRKMRADAPVLVAGVASFPRVEAEKDPELYARWESLTIAYLKGNTGIISVRLSCTTMKNSRTYIFRMLRYRS